MTGVCSLQERGLTSQSPSITVKFLVQYDLKITSVIIITLVHYHSLLVLVTDSLLISGQQCSLLGAKFGKNKKFWENFFNFCTLL